MTVDAPVPSIRTPRFELVSMGLTLMRRLQERDLVGAGRQLGAVVPAELLEGLDAFLRFRIADLSEDPAAQPWLGRAIVIEDAGGRRAIGTVGFHAPPDDEGMVEIGYRVLAAYRRQGVATEVVGAMFEWAAGQGARRFRASTAPDNLASQGVLAKFGLRPVGTQMDDLDGLELVFERDA